MDAANWIALVAVFAGTAASIFTVWWTGKREGQREEQRRADELAREQRARADRRTEHWLDAKRDAYVRFLTEAHSIAEKIRRIAAEEPRGDVHDSHRRWAQQQVLESRLRDRIEELRLFAPPRIADLAHDHARAINHDFAAGMRAADAEWVFENSPDQDDAELDETRHKLDDTHADVWHSRNDVRDAMAEDLGLASDTAAATWHAT